MKDTPIIFSAQMVLALLAGRKTMTRRLAWKDQVAVLERDRARLERRGYFFQRRPGAMGTEHWASPPTPWQRVNPGERLWVRENLTCVGDGIWRYAADEQKIELNRDDPNVPAMIAWAHHQERGSVPSIHMPRWASRLTLVITATKIERVQDISMQDMIAEGLSFREIGRAEHTMAAALRVCDELTPKWEALWRKLHGDASWEANPEVVAISFTVHQKNIDAVKQAA